jgi:glycosyltransferase involved in cell wall biosynthesis
MSNPRPRILHLRASNFVGGPERQLLRYAECDGHGPWELLFGVYVGLEEGREFRDAIASRGIEVISLPVEGLVSSVRSLARVLRERQIGLVCTHGYKADIVSLLAARFAGVPVACFLRGWTRENRRVRLYEALDRFCLRFADLVVCLSKSQAIRLSRQASLAARIRIVSNAINASDINPSVKEASRAELRRRFGLPKDCTVIATGGRLSPEKGVEDFLDAAVFIRRVAAKVRFLIFGSGPLEQKLQRKVIELDLERDVTFAGFERDLRSLLPGVDLLVNPSHSEEMPNIVLEGMAEAIPVVATAVGGVEEISGPQNAVRLVPPAQPSAQAAAVIDLLMHPEKANALGQAGHDRVVQAYSVQAQKDQYRSLYEELLPASDALPSDSASKFASTAEVENVRVAGLEAEGKRPFLSIVVPIRNEEAHVGALLAQLEEQEYPRDRFEVIVVVGTSTDRTVQVVEGFRQRTTLSLRRLDNPMQLSSAGRNIGARNARGDYVIFIDGHCQIASKTLLSDAASLFQRTGADCLCRPQPLTAAGNSLFQHVVARVRATWLGHGMDSTIYSMNKEGPVNPSSAGAMYRRSVFEQIGYYDESFDACEDVEFNHRVLRAGLSSFISPKLKVVYQPRKNLRLLWYQMMRYGRGRFRLIQKHRDAFSFGQIIPATLLFWLVCGGIVSLLWRPFFGVFACSIGAYAVLVSSFSICLGFRHGLRHALIAPLIYLKIHLGLGAGFLVETLRLAGAKRPKPQAIPTTAAKSRSLDPPFSIEI